ncbi:MAG: 3-deoxy-manno-octulosonate cytidylyltransferase [Pseudomonadota bacterium]
MSKFVVVIPARYASERLPGKPLLEILGKPMIFHVCDRARESSALEVIVATDDERIADACESYGVTVCMTGNQHRSGTERIAEVAEIMDWDDSTIVVNLQGDEPTMPASLIDQCAGLLADSDADIATLASPLMALDDYRNPNIVKVVVDQHDNALYFSRSPIPHVRNKALEDLALTAALHHHGIYGYRCGVLRRLVAADRAAIEMLEQLEQLRALSLGMTIRVGRPAERPGAGVDTEDDLTLAAQQLAGTAGEDTPTS